MDDLDNEIGKIADNEEFQLISKELEATAKGLRQSNVSVLLELRGHIQAAIGNLQSASSTCDFLIKAFGERKGGK